MIRKRTRGMAVSLFSIILALMLCLSPITIFAESTDTLGLEEVTEDSTDSDTETYDSTSDSSDSTSSEDESTSDSSSSDSASESTSEDSSWPAKPDINSEAYVLMDYDTGNIICQKDMNKKMYPASITKIMTCLLAVENGNLDDTVTMTQTGVDYAVDGSSNLYTQVGEQFVLRDMLYGMMLKSANDIATQIGEYIGGGDLSHFIDMMNERAKEIGCTGTHFNNACGMPDENHYVTAHDFALIFQEALKNDTFREVISTAYYTMPATNMCSETRELYNHHAMLTDERFAYDGVIGGKNGYTDDAGYTLVTGAERDGRTLIVVTLKATDVGSALNDHINLFDYGFDNFQNVEAMSGDEVSSGGTITIPNDATVDDCSYEDTTDDDGTVTRTWSLDGNEVGSAVLASTEDSSDGEDSQTSGEDNASSTTTTAKNNITGSMLNKVLAVLLVLNVIALLLIIATLAKRKRNRRKRKR